MDIVVYDYPGYGLSTGSTTENGVFLSSRLVHDYVVKELGYSENRVILYGQSIGSGPAIDLASDATRSVGGVVLHCPIASGLRVITNNMEFPGHWFDIFRNLEKMDKVKCPVFIVHGTEDSIVAVEHGLALSRRLSAVSPALLHAPWWVPGADHGDIECSYRKEYLRRLRHFLATLI